MNFTSKHIHSSGGGQVDASRACPGRRRGVSLTDRPPLPCPDVIMETELAAVTEEAWVTLTALSFLRLNKKKRISQSCNQYLKKTTQLSYTVTAYSPCHTGRAQGKLGSTEGLYKLILPSLDGSGTLTSTNHSGHDHRKLRGTKRRCRWR